MLYGFIQFAIRLYKKKLFPSIPAGLYVSAFRKYWVYAQRKNRAAEGLDSVEQVGSSEHFRGLCRTVLSNQQDSQIHYVGIGRACD